MQSAERRYRVLVPAAIASIETNFVRSDQRGVRADVNAHAGCAGPDAVQHSHRDALDWDRYVRLDHAAELRLVPHADQHQAGRATAR
jgi:hypothetical protein